MASDSRKHSELQKGTQNGSMDPKGIVAEDSQTSDNEGGERPVRNKLKETSITSAPKQPADTESAENGQETSRESSRGRKRSFNEDQPEKTEDEPGHRRKRSRDSSLENPSATEEMKTDGDQSGGSPGLKKKRSRDQLDKDAGSVEKPGTSDPTHGAPSDENLKAEGEPEKKRHRDDSQERDSAPIPSAFANTSSVSPFGSVNTSATKPVTSSSAFASSSLAAFAGSEQSPFGSLGSSTPSVFKSAASPATPATTETEKMEKPALSGFAATSKPSGFASLGSGFSGFGGGFGAASSGGGGLTSFASRGGPSAFGSSGSKGFGAIEDESDEEEGKEEDGDTAPGEFAEEMTDERFFERPIETGEEEEKTYFSCKAKLFQFSDKEWRERGVGTFKVNVKVTDGEEDKRAARLIMRADGVLRVMLNTPIFKGMNVGDPSGNEPKSKQIHLACLENNRTVPTLLRTGSEDQAKELYHTIQDLLKQL